MLTEKQIKRIENEVPNVTINEEDNYYSIYVDNPCGEDFTIEINKTEDNQDIQDIINYCENFDPEEHAASWIGGRGAPGLRELLDNSDNIAETLSQLQYCLEHIEEPNLPSKVEIGIEELNLSDEVVEAINNYLADKYGYCNNGFSYGGSIIINDIDWDTKED